MQVDAYDPHILKVDMEKLMKEHMELEINLKDAKKLGPRTCLITMNSVEDKIKVMKNKSKLRTCQKRIYINDDMTKEERKVQEKVRIRAREEKAKGRRVKLGFQKVKIDDEQWIWSKEEKELVKKMERPRTNDTNTKN